MGLKSILLCFTAVALVTFPVAAASFQTYTKKIDLGTQAKLSFDSFVDGNINKVRFLVEKTAAGHIAFGIGSSMSSADIVVIERTESTVTIKDCKLTGQAAPTCSETTESWALSAPGNFELTATSMKVELVRTLATSGTDDDKSIVDGDNDFVYSYTTSNTLIKHDATGGKGTVKFNFKTGALVAKLSSINCITIIMLMFTSALFIF